MDLQNWDQRKCYGHVKRIDFVGTSDNNEEIIIDDFDIKHTANLTGKPLTDGRFQY